MPTENFRLTFHMKFGVILGNHSLLLDSLLAAAVYAETGSVDQAHNALPLDRTEGVWHASAAEIVALRAASAGGVAMPVRRQTIKFISGISPYRDLDSMVGVFTFYNDARGPYNKTNAKCYKASIDEHQMWTAPRIIFYGRGDKDSCRDLAETYLPFIGKKSRQGFGEVSAVTVEAMAEDYSITRDGEAMRPIPVALEERFGKPYGLQRHVRYQPPYWSGDEVKCICPVETHSVKIM